MLCSRRPDDDGAVFDGAAAGICQWRAVSVVVVDVREIVAAVVAALIGAYCC